MIQGSLARGLPKAFKKDDLYCGSETVLMTRFIPRETWTPASPVNSATKFRLKLPTLFAGGWGRGGGPRPRARMKRIGMGIVGAYCRSSSRGRRSSFGFRRCGCRSQQQRGVSARKPRHCIRRARTETEALMDDPDIHVVHNATPNYLHYRVFAPRSRRVNTWCPINRWR